MRGSFEKQITRELTLSVKRERDRESAMACTSSISMAQARKGTKPEFILGDH